LIDTPSIKNIQQEVVISVKALFKSFNGIPILKGLDLDVYKGENLGILGRSGSGKSVLIKIIAGLLEADSGTVNILGKDIAALNSKEWHQLRLKIGFSFQDSALYDSMTIKENLEFALIRDKEGLTREQIDDAVSKVLTEVQLSQSIDKMPAELSGGQVKRVGMARALILEPEIMLYDDPTGGLDPITSFEINKLINDIQKKYKTTSVIITHDLTCAKEICNRIAVFNEGKILMQGSFEEVFHSHERLIKSFYDYNFIN
jgi:phospholipid/cholesterol/gamma-HCH transport system ATP-binding protein